MIEILFLRSKSGSRFRIWSAYFLERTANNFDASSGAISLDDAFSTNHTAVWIKVLHAVP